MSIGKFVSMNMEKKYNASISSLIGKWKQNFEFEIRFKLPSNADFDTVVAKLGVPNKISKTITATSSTQSPDFGVERLEINVETGETEKITKKSRFTFPISGIGAKVSVSSEEPLADLTVNLDTFRYRLRKSFDSYDKNFRIDVTHTDILRTESAAVLKEWKNKMLTNEFAGNIEVEIEWTSLNIPTFSDVATNVFNLLESVASKLDITINNDVTVYELLSEYIPSATDWRSTISKPLPLLRESMKTLHTEPYCVTLKYDGERVILFGVDTTMYQIFAAKIKTFKLSAALKSPIILDGEMYKNTVYVFDSLFVGGNIVISYSFATRYEAIAIELATLSKLGLPFSVERKQFWISPPGSPQGAAGLAELVKSALTVYNKSVVPVDGMIFTPIGREYHNSLTFKWKESEKNSIDFLVKHRDNILDLYVGISLKGYIAKTQRSYFDIKTFKNLGAKANFGPILYESIEKPSTGEIPGDDTIWEFTMVDGKFVPYKFRQDRTDEYRAGKSVFGNEFGVAEEVKETMMNAISIETLTSQTYFVNVSKKGEQQNFQRVNNAIKTKLYMDHVAEGTELVELAAGRGGDLQRWLIRKLTYVLAVDISEDALGQLRTRWSRLPAPVREKLKIETVQCDILGDCGIKIEEIAAEHKFSSVSCMFAMHYFTESIDSFMKFVTILKMLSKRGTKIVLTSFDGKAIYNELKKSNEISLLNDKKEVFTNIKKLYNDGPFADFGQKISVMISTIGAHHEEYLVNYSVIIKIFEESGFETMYEGPFSEFSDLYIRSNKKTKKEALVAELNDDEQTFVSFNRYLVLRKK